MVSIALPLPSTLHNLMSLAWAILCVYMCQSAFTQTKPIGFDAE